VSVKLGAPIAAVVGIVATLAAPRALAQDDASPVRDAISIQMRDGFVEAVQQIATGHEKEGIAALEKIGEQFGGDPDVYRLHYNAACGHARIGAKEPAFAQLTLAVARGYGLEEQQLTNLQLDPDLASLRDDPRFAALVVKAKKAGDELRAHWSETIAPFTWLPPPRKDGDAPAKEGEPAKPETLPLLIVLHPFGVEREAFARSRFLPFCEKHRFALLAPSGSECVAPGAFTWFDAEGDFVEHFREQQQRVLADYQKFTKTFAVDPERVYVTGTGQGAGLAFALAFRNPQWLRGGVLFSGGYAPAAMRDWIPMAAKFGHRLAFVHGETDPLYPVAPLASFVDYLKERSIAAELEKVAGGGHDLGAETITATLERRIAWLDEVPFKKKVAAPGGR
jgi:predicted esterase